MHKVTIVIPVYNVAPYIERSLNSALNQTFPDIEYILVDDKGADNSIEIARSIIEKHLRKNNVKILDHGKNLGVGAVKNTGINSATGKYIYFLDSDDVISPDAIEKLYNEIEQSGADVVIGSYKSIDLEEKGKKWEWLFDKKIIKGKNSVAEYYLNGGYYIMTWNKLYKRDFLLRNKIYCIEENRHKYDDVFFSFQVALNAESIVTIPDVTYYYSFRNGSLMDVLDDKCFGDYYLIIDYLKKYSSQFKNTSIYPKVIYYIYGLTYSFMNQLKNNETVSGSFKKEYLKKFSAKYLSLKEIWFLKGAKTMHKIKYSLSFFPYNVQLSMLRLINTLYKK